MEIVLAEPQEDESMCDLPFQTASLPAGLRARRPHEAAQASHVRPLPLPLPQALLTQSLAAAVATLLCGLGGAEATPEALLGTHTNSQVGWVGLLLTFCPKTKCLL